MNTDEAVIVALGGNLALEGQAVQAVLELAAGRLATVGLKPVRRSGWWRSAAWPDPTEPAYLNAVAWVETSLGPRAVLEALLGIETAFGRRRSLPNAPRTLDLDLIAYGRRVIDEPGLILPHPRAAERLFVMGPLAEIAPGWLHPVTGETAAALAAKATVGADATPI
ncbi:MAG TPA: 2-amino-4-hydroxy-6-hydroxymethyldihydropteridine diphosphokinase [Caulobacteraceae bacterium]